MTRIRSSDRFKSPKPEHAPTRDEQIEALIDALKQMPMRDLTVQEVLDWADPPIRGIHNIWDAHKLITEFERRFGDDHCRYDFTPTGAVRVVSLHKTGRINRRRRA